MRILLLAAALLGTSFALHAGDLDSIALDGAIARLETLERSTGGGDGWHLVHHVVASGEARETERLAAFLHPPDDVIRHRHFLYDATSLGSGRSDSGQAHFGQFALFLSRYSNDRTLVKDVAAGLRAAPRLQQTLRAIEALPAELQQLQVPAERSAYLAWRATPAVQAKKARWSELDISWAIEAMARDAASRGEKLDFILPLLDAQVRLYALDRDFEALNFLPEHGVHIAMTLCRLIPLLDAHGAPGYKVAANAMFAELLSLGTPATFTEHHYAMFGHLLEVAFEREAYRPAVDRARLQVILAGLYAFIGSEQEKGYGFVTHTLRGLKNYRASAR